MKLNVSKKEPSIMSISQHELGRRLRTAREACHMTQEDVAHHVHLSRSSIVQMELGNRAITSLELDRLAYLYGRDIRELLAEDFREDDALVVLVRRHPEVAQHDDVVEALRKCLALLFAWYFHVCRVAIFPRIS